MATLKVDGFTVRAYALEQAVKLISALGLSDDEDLTADLVSSLTINVARPFETFLTGQATDQQQHAEPASGVAKLIT